MDAEWLDEPDEEADDLASSWGIPLNEPLAATPPAADPAENDDDLPPTFLLRPYEQEPDIEFHPRLRRFGEAS
jgi:hypothetical protein